MVSDITYNKIQLIILVVVVGLLIYIILSYSNNNNTQTPSPSMVPCNSFQINGNSGSVALDVTSSSQ